MKLEYKLISNFVGNCIATALNTSILPDVEEQLRNGKEETSAKGAVALPVGMRFGGKSKDDHVLHIEVAVKGRPSQIEVMGFCPSLGDLTDKISQRIGGKAWNADLSKGSVSDTFNELARLEGKTFSWSITVELRVVSRELNLVELLERKAVVEASLQQLAEEYPRQVERIDRSFEQRLASLNAEKARELEQLKTETGSQRAAINEEIAALNAKVEAAQKEPPAIESK